MNPYRNRDLGSEYQSGIIDATKGLGQFLFDQTLLSPQHPYNRFSKRISEVGLLDEDPVMDEIVDEIGLNTIGMGGVLKAIRPVRQNQLSQLVMVLLMISIKSVTVLLSTQCHMARSTSMMAETFLQQFYQ